MSDELQFKLRESPMSEDERRRMVDAFVPTFPASAFGAELRAAIEEAERAGEAMRLALLRDLAGFAPAVESFRAVAAGTLAVFEAAQEFTPPQMPPEARESASALAAVFAADFPRMCLRAAALASLFAPAPVVCETDATDAGLM